jgi:hypothetical protein
MTKKEIAKAKSLLSDCANRFEILSTSSGWCLSVQWVDGGSRIFYSLDAIRDHLQHA